MNPFKLFKVKPEERLQAMVVLAVIFVFNALFIWRMHELFLQEGFLCVYYLFNAKKKIPSGKWRTVTVISTIACFANSCLLPIWNGSLTGAYFLLSIGLSIVSSFTLLIKKSV